MAKLPFFVRFAIVGIVIVFLMQWGFYACMYALVLWTAYQLYKVKRAMDRRKKRPASAGK